jgi:luciferase family oxidoreductase group 1
MSKTPLSILDLAPIVQGSTPAEALRSASDIAQHADRWGYNRYWLAEHHNMTGIASAATSVVIGHIAANTSRIRVGAGGIMLPNHAPLVIAEQFGTLESLYPGRIDLGLGRAPGTDRITMRALRRDRVEAEDDFPREVAELLRLLGDPQPGQQVVAVPGAGTHVPIWLLGSSLFSAQLAAERGLPYAFASHFAPRLLHQAIDLYRSRFRPTVALAEPWVMIGVPLIAAPTDDEAGFLATSVYQRVLGILHGDRRCLPPPVENFMATLHPQERAGIDEFLSAAVIGGPRTVADGLAELQRATQADELILVCDIFDADLRLRSLDIAAAACGLQGPGS